MYILEVGENDVAIERVPVVDMGVLDDSVRDGVAVVADEVTTAARARQAVRHGSMTEAAMSV
jgi:hypothetical protein